MFYFLSDVQNYVKTMKKKRKNKSGMTPRDQVYRFFTPYFKTWDALQLRPERYSLFESSPR